MENPRFFAIEIQYDFVDDLWGTNFEPDEFP